jgi:hypothetical protein
VEPEEISIARQQLGKQVSAATDTQATRNCCKLCFLFSPSKVVVKKGLVENRQLKYRRLKSGSGQAYNHSTD